MKPATDREVELLMARFAGLPVHASPYVPEFTERLVQVRFPRSRKRRIRKKWASRTSNFRTVRERVIYMVQPGAFDLGPISLRGNRMEQTLFVNPELIRALGF